MSSALALKTKPQEFLVKLKESYKNNDPFFGTFIVTVAMYVQTVLSYILTIVIARYFGADDAGKALFGLYNTFLALAAVFNFSSASLGTTYIKVVTEIKAKNKFDVLTKLYKSLTMTMVLIMIILFTFFALTKNLFANYFHIDNPDLMLLFATFIGAGFLVSVPYAYLQGLLRFKAFSFFTILRSFLRLFIVFSFLFFGFKVGGILAGLSLAPIVAYFVGSLLLRKNFFHEGSVVLTPYYKRIFSFLGPVLLVNLGITLLNTIDMLLVRHHLQAVTSGTYGGLIVIGKVIQFGAGPVAIVMYPQISALFEKNRPYLDKFKKFLYIQVFLIVGALVAFTLFPQLIVNILFSGYDSVVQYLPRYAIFMCLYVLATFMAFFFLAINKPKIYYIYIPAVLIQGLLINFVFNNSIEQVINVNIAVVATLLVSLFGYFYYITKSSKT